MSKVVSQQKLTERRTAYVIEAPDIAASAGAGQLVLARMGDQVLFTPHAITDWEPEKGTITIVSRAAPDEAAVEVRGPVGQTSTVEGAGKVLCVGEDLGVAALLPRLRELKEKGCYTIVIAAYPSKDEIYWRDRIEPYCDELYVVTEDGSFGVKGPARQTVKAVCENVTDIDRAVMIAPLTVMKKCSEVTRNYEIPTLISLGAVVEGEDQLVSPDRAPERFDWHGAADLDAQQVDFDRLTEQLGIQPTK